MPFLTTLALCLSYLSAVSFPERQPLRDRKAIAGLLARFVEAWNAGDAARAAEVYADPHVDENAPVPLETREQTRAKWEAFFQRFESRIAVSSDELIVLGDWALQRGELQLTLAPKSGGAPSTRRRRYVEVLKKEDGAWRVFWGIDGPVAEESPDP